MDQQAVAFVRTFVESGKPIARSAMDHSILAKLVAYLIGD
jgi:hypothetical protein